MTKRDIIVKAIDLISFELGSCEGKINALRVTRYDVLHTTRGHLEERAERLKEIQKLLLEAIDE
jgi:hypothetical protein